MIVACVCVCVVGTTAVAKGQAAASDRGRYFVVGVFCCRFYMNSINHSKNKGDCVAPDGSDGNNAQSLPGCQPRRHLRRRNTQPARPPRLVRPFATYRIIPTFTLQPDNKSNRLAREGCVVPQLPAMHSLASFSFLFKPLRLDPSRQNSRTQCPLKKGLGVVVSVVQAMIERVNSQHIFRANTLCHKIPLPASSTCCHQSSNMDDRTSNAFNRRKSHSFWCRYQESRTESINDQFVSFVCVCV